MIYRYTGCQCCFRLQERFSFQCSGFQVKASPHRAWRSTVYPDSARIPGAPEPSESSLKPKGFLSRSEFFPSHLGDRDTGRRGAVRDEPISSRMRITIFGWSLRDQFQSRLGPAHLHRASASDRQCHWQWSLRRVTAPAPGHAVIRIECPADRSLRPFPWPQRTSLTPEALYINVGYGAVTRPVARRGSCDEAGPAAPRGEPLCRYPAVLATTPDTSWWPGPLLLLAGNPPASRGSFNAAECWRP